MQENNLTDKDIDLIVKNGALAMARQLEMIEAGYLDAIRYPIGRLYNELTWSMTTLGDGDPQELAWEMRTTLQEFASYSLNPTDKNRKSKGFK